MKKLHFKLDCAFLEDGDTKMTLHFGDSCIAAEHLCTLTDIARVNTLPVRKLLAMLHMDDGVAVAKYAKFKLLGKVEVYL